MYTLWVGTWRGDLTLLEGVDRVKSEGCAVCTVQCAPPHSRSWAENTTMTECTRESGISSLCTLLSVVVDERWDNSLDIYVVKTIDRYLYEKSCKLVLSHFPSLSSEIFSKWYLSHQPSSPKPSPMIVFSVWCYHRVHTEWQWPLSGVHSIMMVKSAQPGKGGWCPLTLSTVYLSEQNCGVRSSRDRQIYSPISPLPLNWYSVDVTTYQGGHYWLIPSYCTLVPRR